MEERGVTWKTALQEGCKRAPLPRQVAVADACRRDSRPARAAGNLAPNTQAVTAS